MVLTMERQWSACDPDMRYWSVRVERLDAPLAEPLDESWSGECARELRANVLLKREYTERVFLWESPPRVEYRAGELRLSPYSGPTEVVNL
jgi:hypothetical protein